MNGKRCNIYTQGTISLARKGTSVTTQADLEGFMLSEVSRIEENKTIQTYLYVLSKTQKNKNKPKPKPKPGSYIEQTVARRRKGAGGYAK